MLVVTEAAKAAERTKREAEARAAKEAEAANVRDFFLSQSFSGWRRRRKKQKAEMVDKSSSFFSFFFFLTSLGPSKGELWQITTSSISNSNWYVPPLPFVVLPTQTLKTPIQTSPLPPALQAFNEPSSHLSTPTPHLHLPT